MTVYVQNAAASDLSPFADGNREMAVAAGGDGSFATGNIGAGSSQFHGFITPAGVPNSDAWEDSGNWPVELEIDSGDADMRGRIRAVRLDSTGTVLQTGSFTAFQNLDVSRAYTVVAPAWTNGEEACDNRLAIEIEFNCNAPHGNCGVTVGLGTTSNEVTTDVTEDTAGCAVATKPFYYTTWRRRQQGSM